MSRRIHLAPVALTSDGSVIVNVAGFDVTRNPEALVELAKNERGRLFIGVELGREEVEGLLRHSQDGLVEGSARIIGGRQKRRRRWSGR